MEMGKNSPGTEAASREGIFALLITGTKPTGFRDSSWTKDSTLGFNCFILISDFIASCGWRSPDRRNPQSGDISDQAEGLQEPDQDHHEHDYVEQTFDRTGHRDIGIDYPHD
jgi:hypothetical protein